MTQQGDMTSQEPGAAQPGPGSGQPSPAEPVWPSPYLSEGQSIPEAYPAPPQTGQPRYGDPGGTLTPGRPAGTGRQSYAQPGSGQARVGQRGYQADGPQGGRPPGYGPSRSRTAGQPGQAQIAQRDPALAAAWERLLAMSVDWILILAAAFLVTLSPMLRIWHQLEPLINSATLGQPATQTAISNVVQAPSTAAALIRFWLVAMAIALAYFWVLPAVWGATVGKQVVGLRVVSAADRSRISIRTAGLRAVAFLAGPAVLMLVPDVGLIGGLAWLADGTALLLDGQMQSLHDRVAGTTVIRKRWLDEQSRQARPSPW